MDLGNTGTFREVHDWLSASSKKAGLQKRRVKDQVPRERERESNTVSRICEYV